MHFHTGREDQCPEAHYIPLTREKVRVDVFMCPQPLSTHPPTHTHHDALQDLIANSTNSTEAMSKRLYKYVTWLTLTPIGQLWHSVDKYF